MIIYRALIPWQYAGNSYLDSGYAQYAITCDEQVPIDDLRDTLHLLTGIGRLVPTFERILVPEVEFKLGGS